MIILKDNIVVMAEHFLQGLFSEFGKPMKLPSLNEVIQTFENSNKPIVAALHGTLLEVA